MDGWNTSFLFWDGLFSGAMLVSWRVDSLNHFHIVGEVFLMHPSSMFLCLAAKMGVREGPTTNVHPDCLAVIEKMFIDICLNMFLVYF